MAKRRPGRRGRQATAAALALAVAVMIAGCGQSQQPHVRGAEVLTGHVERLSPGSVSARQVAAAESAFGLALFGKACPAMPTSNLLLSPDSAAEVLGMLYSGAEGPTATAMGRLLRLPAWSPALVAALHQHTAALARVRQLQVSNHLFEQTGSRPAQSMLNDLRTAYGTGLQLVDFGHEPAATTTINAVVSRDTHGLIPDLFGQPLATSTRLVLTNALYLKARWQQPFTSASPARFRTAAGTVVTASLMHSIPRVAGYHRAGGWQSATLPYTGGDLAAVAILPPAGTTGCAVPTTAQWAKLTATDATAAAGVNLPKLRLSQTWDQLQATLAAMGLPLNGNYAGLGAGGSQISQIVQKATMDVSETGTTAAAATGIAVGSAEPAGPQVTLTFNRPFLLVLEDTATRTPLFLARIANPAQT
jgi:serpin B